MQDFEKPKNWLGAGTPFEPHTQWIGIVVQLFPFGARVELPGGLTGMVHISDIIQERGQTLEEMLQVGQVVTVLIRATDPGSNRVSLGMNFIRGGESPRTGLFAIEQSWLTDNVIDLAKSIRADGYKDRALVAILADVLQEAGCNIEPLLAYCRDLSSAREWHGWWVAQSILRMAKT